MLLRNELCDGFFNLESETFTTTHVRDDPKIYTGWAVFGGKDKLKGSSSKDEGQLKGYILIRDLYTQGTDSIHDMRIMNTSATS